MTQVLLNYDATTGNLHDDSGMLVATWPNLKAKEHVGKQDNVKDLLARNVSIDDIIKLDKAGFAAASGAACSSVNPGQSHVLEAMGVNPMLARCAVRVSLGRHNTMSQVENLLQQTKRIVAELKGMNSVTI